MPLIEVSQETLDKLRKQLGAEIAEVNSLADLVGQCWFFRSVTYHLVGRVKKHIGGFLVLEDASWVADSGRFTQAIKDGTLNEVEPVGTALLNISTIVDAFPWRHALPTEQK